MIGCSATSHIKNAIDRSSVATERSEGHVRPGRPGISDRVINFGCPVNSEVIFVIINFYGSSEKIEFTIPESSAGILKFFPRRAVGRTIIPAIGHDIVNQHFILIIRKDIRITVSRDIDLSVVVPSHTFEHRIRRV